MDEAKLEVKVLGPRSIAWTIVHPRRKNAVSSALLREIAARSAALRGEVVRLSGAGDEMFCSGSDLSELSQADPSSEALPDAALIAATSAMRNADATFLAVLGGHAIGAGVELAAACDLRIAREGVSFRLPAARIGVVYHEAGLARIEAVFGTSLTARLVLLGETITAEEAYRAGALVRLVPRTELHAEADRIADSLLRSAPLALQGNRDLLRALREARLDPATKDTHHERRVAAYRSAEHLHARETGRTRAKP